MAVKGYLPINTEHPIMIPAGSKILDVKLRDNMSIEASIMYGRDPQQPGVMDEISFTAIGEGMEVDIKKWAYAGNIMIGKTEISVFYKIKYAVKDTRVKETHKLWQ